MQDQTLDSDLGTIRMTAQVRSFACLSNTIPDLSDLQTRVMLDYILNSILRGVPSASDAGLMSIVSYIRASDKAIAEYEAARKAASELDPAGSHSAFLRTLDHFESCIQAVARCDRIKQRFKAELRKPAIPTDLKKSLQTYEKTIREQRNAIEHVEQEIVRRAKDGQGDLFLYFTKECDGLVISGNHINFENLAQILRLQHQLTRFLANYSEAVAIP